MLCLYQVIRSIVFVLKYWAAVLLCLFWSPGLLTVLLTFVVFLFFCQVQQAFSCFVYVLCCGCCRGSSASSSKHHQSSNNKASSRKCTLYSVFKHSNCTKGTDFSDFFFRQVKSTGNVEDEDINSIVFLNMAIVLGALTFQQNKIKFSSGQTRERCTRRWLFREWRKRRGERKKERGRGRRREKGREERGKGEGCLSRFHPHFESGTRAIHMGTGGRTWSAKYGAQAGDQGPCWACA